MFRVKSLSGLSPVQGEDSLFLQNFALGIFFNIPRARVTALSQNSGEKIADLCILIDSFKVNLGMRVDLPICLSAGVFNRGRTLKI